MNSVLEITTSPFVPNPTQDRSCHEQRRAARIYVIIGDRTLTRNQEAKRKTAHARIGVRPVAVAGINMCNSDYVLRHSTGFGSSPLVRRTPQNHRNDAAFLCRRVLRALDQSRACLDLQPHGHAFTSKIGAPSVARSGVIPRPGASLARMRPFCRCGASGAITTVP